LDPVQSFALFVRHGELRKKRGKADSPGNTLYYASLVGKKVGSGKRGERNVKGHLVIGHAHQGGEGVFLGKDVAKNTI